MAESIFTTIKNGTADVSHKGQELKAVKLPNWMQGLNLENEDELIQQLSDAGQLLRTLQNGVKQHLIDFRATVRPADLPPKEKGGDTIPVSIIADEDNARKRGLEYKPDVMLPPSSPEQKASKVMQSLTPEQLKAMLTPEQKAALGIN